MTNVMGGERGSAADENIHANQQRKVNCLCHTATSKMESKRRSDLLEPAVSPQISKKQVEKRDDLPATKQTKD
jgi:hypothetical protein